MDWPWNRPAPRVDDLHALRQDIADLRSEIKRIRAEWEDMFERLCRREDRLRKRESRADQGPMTLQDRKRLLRARIASNGRS